MDLKNIFNLENIAPILAASAVLGTVLGIVIRGWTSIKGFFARIFSIFFATASLEDEATSKAVLAYLIGNYGRTASDKIFGGRYDCFRDGKYGHIPFEMIGEKTVLFWNWLIPFWFVVEAPKAGADDKKATAVYIWGSAPKENKKTKILYLRWTLNVEKIVKAASIGYNQVRWDVERSKRKRFFVQKIPSPFKSGFEGLSAGVEPAWYQEGIYRLLNHDPSELGKASPSGGAIDKLYFPAYVKKLIEEVKAWHDLKDWYRQRFIPWKRGWCLYGPPGTGKTALVRAIAEDLDMPLFSYALGHMLDKDLELSWEHMQAHTPCIALFEDFDTVFHGRQNVYGKPSITDQIASANMKQQAEVVDINIGKLSFGCLLNCIDGADKTGGIFTIFTTNHIDKLDAALCQPRQNPDGSVDYIGSRPGRVDRAIELGYMCNDDKELLARRIFFDDAQGLEIMMGKIQQEPERQETPAQFQERCAQLALELLWKRPASRIVIPFPSRNGVHV